MGKNSWLGLENYVRVLSDLKVRKALFNTLRYVFTSVPLQTGISLVIAALLAANLQNRFGGFVRGAIFVPVLCSATLIASIFAYIFASNADSLANQLVQLFGIGKVNWLGNPKVTPWVIIGISVWKNVGYFVVLFYAGIMDIPKTLYEASQLDGASKLQQFFKITIPNLKSIIFMVISVGTIWSFQFFDLSYVMTAGGPADSTITLVHVIHSTGFKAYRFGYGSAISVVLFLCVVVINLLQNLLMKEDD